MSGSLSKMTIAQKQASKQQAVDDQRDNVQCFMTLRIAIASKSMYTPASAEKDIGDNNLNQWWHKHVNRLIMILSF